MSDYGPNSQLMLSARINWSRIDLPIGEGGKADQIAGREAGQELEQFFAASLGESTRLEEARGEEVDGAGSPVASRVGNTSLPSDSRRASCRMSSIINPSPAKGAGARCRSQLAERARV